MSVSEQYVAIFGSRSMGEFSATGKQDRLTGEAVYMRIGVPSAHSYRSSHLSDKCS